MISVVIPAYNEEKTIGRCLDAFARQDTKEKFEIIVVDNASTDKTVEIVNSYSKKLPLRLVREKLKGRSPARKKGFTVAGGEVILSTDADTVVPPNWIGKMTSYFKDDSVSAVSGICKIDDCSPRINLMFNIFQPLSMKVYRITFGHYWLSGFNFGIRKSIYEKSGGFNPRLNIQEDTDLAFRVSKIGNIKYVPKPCVFVSGRRVKNGFLRGVLPYFTSFFKYKVLKSYDKVNLSDVR